MAKNKKRRFRNKRFAMLGPDLIESQAFMELSGKSAYIVLIRFYQKAKRYREKKGSKRPDEMTITNNGEIVFTYGEASEFGISKATFYRAIRELIEDKGFMDLAEPGDWYSGQPNKFSISERWKWYGTDQYKAVRLPRQLPRGKGFQKSVSKMNTGASQK